jgi:hypothetical protein
LLKKGLPTSERLAARDGDAYFQDLLGLYFDQCRVFEYTIFKIIPSKFLTGGGEMTGKKELSMRSREMYENLKRRIDSDDEFVSSMFYRHEQFKIDSVSTGKRVSHSDRKYEMFFVLKYLPETEEILVESNYFEDWQKRVKVSEKYRLKIMLLLDRGGDESEF